MTDATIPVEIVERVARAIDRYRNPYSKPSDTRHMLHAPEALAALAALPPGALAVWQPIATMPRDTLVLVSDGDLVKPGTRVAEDVIAAPILTTIKLWTHWMPLPPPPAQEPQR